MYALNNKALVGKSLMKKSISKTNLLKHESFKFLNLLIHAIGVTSENVAKIDVGELHLDANGREYKLTFSTLLGSLESNEVHIGAELESFDVCKATFDDCAFDLLESDLLDPSLSATVHLSCESIEGGSVYLALGEFQYNNLVIKVKQDMAIHNCHIGVLNLEFDGDVEKEGVYLGGVTLKDSDTGRTFTLDTKQTFTSKNKICVEMQCIAEMLIDDKYGIDDPMNLTLNDLSSKNLVCAFYFDGDGDASLTKGSLSVNDGSKEIILAATPE